MLLNKCRNLKNETRSLHLLSQDIRNASESKKDLGDGKGGSILMYLNQSSTPTKSGGLMSS